MDESFAAAKKIKRRGGTNNANVLIVGLPGSGKSASVMEWAKRNKVNLVFLKSTSSDLDALLNGYPALKPDSFEVAIATSSALSALEKPNSVLFLDEFNRQTNKGIRGSLFTLINEHYVAGKGEGNIHYFKNLLFTIACINPAVAGDTGVTDLVQAELGRFVQKAKAADSDPMFTYDYLLKKYDHEINKILKKLKDNTISLSDPYVLEDLEDYLRIQDLGCYIVSDPDFERGGYDTFEDLDELDASGDTIRNTLLNQRSLVDGLVLTDGNVDKFRDWLENSADFLPRKTELLLGILDTYNNPSFEELCAKKKISLTDFESNSLTPTKTTKNNNINTTATTTATEYEEDDDGLFAGTTSKAGVKNSIQTKIDIQKALNNF